MLCILQSRSGQRGKGGLECIRYEPRVEREGNGWESKSLKGKPPVGMRAKNAKGIESMRRRGQVCNNGACWQLCARVSCLLALACVHTRVRVCVCLVNCALTTCLVKAS